MGGITVPRYYWMAILAQRGDHYQSIAFWVEHTRPAEVDRPRSVAISIDQLEKRTGLDFFHNLPDNTHIRNHKALNCRICCRMNEHGRSAQSTGFFKGVLKIKIIVIF